MRWELGRNIGILTLGVSAAFACGNSDHPHGAGSSAGAPAGGLAGRSAGAGTSGARATGGATSGSSTGGTHDAGGAAGQAGDDENSGGTRAGTGGTTTSGAGGTTGSSDAGASGNGNTAGAAGDDGGPVVRVVETCAEPEDASRFANGATLYVDDDPGCEGLTPCFGAVATAWYSAHDGDTIVVLPGRIWGGRIEMKDDVGNLRITSRDGPEVTSIEEYCLEIAGGTHAPGQVWVDHLTFRDCGPSTSTVDDGWGIFANTWDDLDIRIQDNVFEPPNGRGAIALWSDTVNTRFHAVVARNRILDQAGEEPALSVSLPADGTEDYCIRIENNLLAGNDTALTIAYSKFQNGQGRFEVVNNTIARNTFGLMFSTPSGPYLVANNILFDNGTELIPNAEIGPFTFTHNLIDSGQFTGIRGNFSADPVFVDPDQYDFRLVAGSPAVGRGDPAPAPLEDVNGASRGRRPDVGAIERDQGSGETLSGLSCGDDVVERGSVSTDAGSRLGYETCDDGNSKNRDGCSAFCQREPAVAPWGLISRRASSLCVVRLDQSLSCWGSAASHVPAGAFTQVAVSAYHACALDLDGHPVCWRDSSSPPFTPTGTFKQLASDDYVTCGLAADGISCWNDQELESSHAGAFASVFTNRRVCALSDAGAMTCWDPYSAFPTGPFLQVLPDINPGGCGLRTDGTVVCTDDDVSSFISTDEPQAGFVRIDASHDTVVALRPDGRALQWRLGNLTIPSTDHVFVDVAAGNGSGCGLTAARQVFCWNTPADFPAE